MSLKERITEDMKTAMRAKDAGRLRALRAVLSVVKNRSIELKGEVSEREIATLIQREVKQCKETLDFARQAGRADQVAEHEELLGILEGLLPQTAQSSGSPVRGIGDQVSPSN